MTELGFGMPISPLVLGRRRYSPYWSRGRRHHRRFSRRISPFATTVIGRRPYSPIRRVSVSPRRGMISSRKVVSSPVRRGGISPMHRR